MSAGANGESEIVAVLGAGSWGSALAHLLAGKNLATRLWARDGEAARRLTADGENDKYLRGTSLASVEVSADLGKVVNGATWIVSAVPCAAVPEIGRTLRAVLPQNCFVISGTKGLHPESGLRASEVWAREAGINESRLIALSGPNLAREIAAGVPTSTVVASLNEGAAQAAQSLFSTPSFRVYTNSDLVGVELGGALKNVVAIAAGMGDGLGFGDNSKAALVTRAWQEMTRLAVALGARESTLWGLSGMGDLIATCVSPYSRNRQLGEHLASGETLGQAQHEIKQVAEGVHTTRAALSLAKKYNIELPVTEQVAAVLFGGCDVRSAVSALMQRQGCSEF